MERFLKRAENCIQAILGQNLVLYAFVLPWGHAPANILMAFMAFAFLLKLLLRPAAFEVSRQKLVLLGLFSAFFWVCFASLIYSQNLDRGIDSILRKAPMLFFPVYVLLTSKVTRNRVIASIEMFSYSVLILAVISLLKASINLYTSSEILDWEIITGEKLSQAVVSVHKLYFALYALIAILFLTYLTFLRKSPKFRLFLQFGAVLFLLFFLLMLGTRTTLTIGFVFVFLFSSIFMLKERQYLVYSMLVTFLIILTAVIINQNPILQDRLKESVNYQNEYGINKQWGGTAVRKLIWKYSFILFRKEPLFGTGIGDAQDELNKVFQTVTESSALKGKQYNTHSEILQILINTGLFGLLVFYGSQILILKIQDRKNLLLKLFLLVFFLSGITEAYLERDMGVRIFAFFSVLLFVTDGYNENTSNT